MNLFEPFRDSIENSSSHKFINNSWEEPLRRCPRVISVSSGKGGVGKTNVVANLGLALTQLGKRVFVLDADLALANLDILLGLTPRYTIEHLFKGEKTLSQILINGPGGMFIMPASSGTPELADLDDSQKIFLLDELGRLEDQVDIFLIDAGTGISSNVLFFNTAAQEMISIVTPEPTSISAAYALIKILSIKFLKKEFLILVNQVSGAREAREVFKKLHLLVDRCLGSLSLGYLGFIPHDERIRQAVRKQKTVLELYPDSSSSQSFRRLARTIAQKPIRHTEDGSVQFFRNKLLRYSN